MQLHGRIALVTGASRGIGAEVAQQLAGPDTQVLISDEASAAAMIDDIARRFGRLDILVLNASGGDRDAQRRIAQLALPLMPAGGHIVFVTSHQAHFYPHKAVPKGYAAVAASMRAGETALHAMRAEFDRRGVHFTVVSGEMIDGSTIVDLLKRRNPAAAAPRGGHVELPSVNDFAVAIATVATSPNPTGIVFVGGPDHLTRMSA